MEIPLAVKAADYNSIKQKGLLVNMIAEANRTGNFISIRRLDGLTEIDSSLSDPIRSNFHENGGTIYFVAGTVLYSFTPSATTPT